MIIYITRELNDSELQQVQNAAAHGAIVYADEAINKFPFAFQIVPFSDSDKSILENEVLDRICQWPEHTKLVEALSVDNFYLWYYHRFRLSYVLREYFLRKKVCQLILKENDPLRIYTAYASWNTLLGKELGVEVVPQNQVQQDKVSQFEWIKYSVYNLRRYISFKLNKKAFKHYILSTSSHEHPLLQLKTGNIKKDNAYLSYLLNGMKSDSCVIDEVPLPGTTAGKITSRYAGYPFSDRNCITNEGVLIDGLLSGNCRSKVANSMHSFSLVLEDYVAKDDFDTIIVNELWALTNTTKLYLFRYFAWRSFFENVKTEVSTVSAIGENNSLPKSILDAAKFHEIRTIGIQHGTIHNLNMHYRYGKKDMEYSPAPDEMMVWGEHWKSELVTLGNYPENSINVSGQLRTDIIPEISSSSDQSEGVTTIMFASQPFRSMELRTRALVDVLRAVKGIPDVRLYIRPHPNEADDVFFTNLANQEGVSNYYIERKEDLYLALAKIHGLVTCYSTVGTECVYFDKPLFTLDYGSKDVQGYAKEGVAIACDDSKRLESALKELCSGELKVNKENYDNFIAKYAYKIDGNTANRIWKVIEDE